YHERTIREIRRRGMIYQAIGHGWTGRFFGLPDSMCDQDSRHGRFEVSSEDRQYLAMVNGERISGNRGAVFTELCYGNPETRRRLVQAAADYAEEHPEVDILHFWLSDATNANCECDLCRDTRPS